MAAATGDIALVDPATGAKKGSLKGQGAAIVAMSLSSDGSRLAAAEASGTTRIWDVAKSEVWRTVTGGAPLTAVALHPQGAILGSSHGAGQVQFWSLEAPDIASIAQLEAPATAAATSIDGRLLAAATLVAGKPVVIVRDLAAGTVVQTLSGHEAAVVALAFTPDGQKLVTGSDDKTARIWTVADGKEVAKFAAHGGPVTTVAVDGAGHAASGAADGSLKLWNQADGVELKSFAGHAGAIQGLALKNDGLKLYSSGADKTVRAWNTADGAAIGSTEQPAATTGLALSRDEAKLAVALADGTVRMLQESDRNPVATLPGAAPAHGLRFSADSARLLIARAATLESWNVAAAAMEEAVAADSAKSFANWSAVPGEVILSGKALRRAAPHFLRFAEATKQPVTKLVFKPDGSMLFAGCADGNLRGITTATGGVAFTANHSAAIRDVAVSPNGGLLATAGDDNTVKLWSDAGAAAAKPQLIGFTAPVRSVAFSPDSTRVVAASVKPGEAFAFNVASGTVDQTFAELTSPVSAVEVAADAAPLVIALSEDQSISFLPLSALGQLVGHEQPVTALAAVPTDKKALVSGGLDGHLHGWNCDNFQSVSRTDVNSPISALAVRGDGIQAAVATNNGLIRFFDARNGLQAWQAPNNVPIAEIKGDVLAQLRLFQATHQVTLLTARAADDKKQTADAETRVTQAAEAIKSAATAKETSAKTLGEKREAAKAPVAAKEAADKLVETLKAEAAKAVETQTAAKAAAEKDANNAELAKARDEANKLVEETTRKFKESEQKAREANEPAAKALQEVTTAEAGMAAAEQAAMSAATNSEKAAAAVPLAKEAQALSDKLLTDAAAEVSAATAALPAFEKPFKALVYSPSGSKLYAAAESGRIRLIETEFGGAGDTLQGHAGAVSSLAMSAAGDLISGSVDKTAIVWAGNPTWTLERTIGSADGPSELTDRVVALAFSPDGKLLATGGGEPSRSGELKLWNVADGALFKTIADAHSDVVCGVEFSPDGQYLASAAADRFMKVFNVSTGALTKAFEGHTHQVLDVSWKGDGKLLVSSGADNVVKVWEFASGEQLRTSQPIGKEATSIVYLPEENKALVSSGDRNVRLLNVDNGNYDRGYGSANDFLYCVAMTPDKRYVLGAGQESVVFVWNFENGQVVRRYEAPQPAKPAEASTVKK